MTYSFFWLCFISLAFWSLYQKWDAKQHEYVDHPKRTILYFIFSSFVIVFIFPDVLTLLKPTILNVLFFIVVVWFTFFIYKVLKSLFQPPKSSTTKERAYWKLLDEKYVWPKITEIFYQQTFFGAFFLLLSKSDLTALNIFIIAISAFIVAHIPLYFLQDRKVATFYLLWSIIGAPVFGFILIATGSLWYTVSIHFFFYTLLSIFSWIFGKTKY